MKRRLLSLLMVFALLLGMMPVSAFAEEIPVSVTVDEAVVETVEVNDPLPDLGMEVIADETTASAETVEEPVEEEQVEEEPVAEEPTEEALVEEEQVEEEPIEEEPTEEEPVEEVLAEESVAEVLAEEETSCLSVAADAPTGVTIKAGEKYSLELSDVFADSEGHALTYSFASTIENQHTKIIDGVFYFSAAAGTNEVTLTAKCEAKEVSHKLTITVEAGNAGITEQYNYNETAAESVKVYVTLSNDGYPVAAKDGTPMSHLEVTVPYFDLALYGLEDYYRYGTANGSGEYINNTVIKRPTGLHLYIYLLERYYMGMDEADCGKGESEPLSYAAKTDVLYMDGTEAYSNDGKRALQISGGPTSLYMVNFWGHDENLMYFRNHCYPYMSPGWGSTSDYILLSDGDTWDVAMFSNWEFHNYGYFARFDQDEYTAEAGKSLTVKTQKWGTSAAAAGFADATGLDVGLYTDEWELMEGVEISAAGNSLTFTAPAAAGTYYLMAMDPSAKDAKDACIAPATAILTVTAGTVECETCTDENKDRTCDVCGKNLNNLPALAEGVENRTVLVQTGWAYQVDDLVSGRIFTDADSDSLTYSYRKSSDSGKTWGEWMPFGETLVHGGVNKSLTNSTAGTYTYEFKSNDGFGDSEARWFLTLETRDVVPANVKFYLGQDNNYKDNGNIMPVLELYKTAGLDEDLFDYVGWFQKDGKTEYVYNPQDYTIIDGETDYVVIGEVQYELHDYEKVTFTDSLFGAAPGEGETATPSGTVVSNYNMFYATITTGRYSTRVYGYNTATSVYDIYLGGQSMGLPMEVDIYGNGGNDIYLRQVDVYTTSKKLDDTYFTADDYYAEIIMPITGGMIHSGDPYISGNYTKFPFFSWAAGNGSLYNTYVYPKDTDAYIFTQANNNTTSAGTSVVAKSMVINAAIVLKATVPAAGDFGLYMQYNNFNTKKAEPVDEAILNGDGTKTLTYKVSKSNGNYTWRLSDPSGTYVTKAGWLKNANQASEQTFTFSEFTNKASHDFSNLGTAVATRDEADLQVFLSATGFKSVSGTTRIRAYRMWEIINSDSGNIMVEPDFNIQVLQGNASDISLVSGGNVKNNWIDVTPTTTDIVAVNYDAVEMVDNSGSYGSHGGLFPATNPERTNVFIITNEAAGSAVAHIPFNGSKSTDRGAEWDYNYDTWSYLNTDAQPNLNFTVSAGSNLSVSYAYVITGSDLKSTMSGWNYATADANGTYNVSLMPFRTAGTKGGTVIIKMTDSTGTSYALVRAAEMAVTVANVSTPGEPFMPGDQVSVTFDGLYRSINKISGIFNPTTYYLRYTAGDVEINGSLGQYQQMDRTTLKLTIPENIEFPEGQTTMDYSFTNGYVSGNMYSAASPFQSMYYITDTGVGTNFSAVGTSFVMSRFADITVTVQKKVVYDTRIQVTDGENALSDYTFTLTDPDGTVLIADENGIYQDLGYGEYSYYLAKVGYVCQYGTLKLGSADAENVVDGTLVKTIVAEKAAEGAWDGTTVTEPAQIDGIYQISSGAELAWFAQTVNAGTTNIKGVLTADIDLACYNWTPIGNSNQKFAGSLDGQNHKVCNLAIVNTAATNGVGYGFIGYMNGGSVQNLTVEGTIDLTNSTSVSNGYTGGVIGACTGSVTLNNVHANVDITIDRVKGNWARVGGLVGSGGSVIITNCSNSGDISGYQYVAGIVAYLNSGGTVTGCYNTGEISGYQYVGGIAASGAPGTVTSCYNIGDVTATNNYVGGIISNCTSTSALSNCFNAGKITFGGSTAYAGSVVGYSNNANGTNANLYYLEGTYSTGIGKNLNTVDATAVSAETLASRAFAKAMNVGLATPVYAVGTTHPILSWQDPSAEVPDPNVCDHEWIDATCTTPKTCSLCGATEGEVDPDAHSYVGGLCEYCGLWKEADYSLLSGKSLTLKYTDPETDKVLTSKQIAWTLPEEYAPYATVTAAGKLTARKVMERVQVEVIGTILTAEDTFVVATVDIYPSVSHVQIVDTDVVNGQTLNVDSGAEALVLTANVYPLDAMGDVTWTISDSKETYASYAKDGNTLTVTPKAITKAGTVTLKATSTDGSKKTATVKLQFGTYAKSVVIDKSVTQITAGDKAIQLTATMTPEKVTKTGIVWTLKNANDKNSVSLSSSGKITPKNVLAPVDVTVVATSKDGMARDEHTIRILPKSAAQLVLKSGDAYVTKTTQTLDVNNQESITISAHTYGETEKTAVTWTYKANKAAVFTENDDGTLTVQMVAPGSVTVTAKTADKRSAAVTIKGVKLAESLTISQKKTDETADDVLEVASGKSLEFQATLENAADKKVTWSVEEGARFASVSTSGKVTAKKDLTSGGKVVVRATAADGSGATDTISITVRPLAQGVQVYSKVGGQTVFSLRSDASWWVRSNTIMNWDLSTQGNTFNMSTRVYPFYGAENARNAIQKVTWKSSSSKIASVDEEGVVTIHKSGTVTLTATATDGSGQKISFKLKVVKTVTALTIADQTVKAGKSLNLSKQITIEPEDATNKKLTWEITDGNDFATISSSGVLKAQKVKETQVVEVTVSSQDGGAQTTCKVTITP